MQNNVQQYLIVTGNYWVFTLTDGALRMLVVLHFHALGYSPLDIALLFIFYEAFGVLTNLVGGYLGTRFGLNRTMNLGLGLQVAALCMLLVPAAYLTVPWVMAAQALSGIAKDLNKTAAKSSIKLFVPDAAQGQLYRWVALLTGSKNALKGLGFFVGGVLLSFLGFSGAIGVMAMALALVWLMSLCLLQAELGKSAHKPKFSQILSKSRAINLLSAARLFLFGARDVWFVIALPVYLSTKLGWDQSFVGGFLACWIMGYGLVQALAPALTSSQGRSLALYTAVLAFTTGLIAAAQSAAIAPTATLLVGLMLFGGLFAIVSAVHSYWVVAYASADEVALDVGFYYMANAMGRLGGTVLSGWVYQAHGLSACLWTSAGCLLLAALISTALPGRSKSRFSQNG